MPKPKRTTLLLLSLFFVLGFYLYPKALRFHQFYLEYMEYKPVKLLNVSLGETGSSDTVKIRSYLPADSSRFHYYSYVVSPKVESLELHAIKRLPNYYKDSRWLNEWAEVTVKLEFFKGFDNPIKIGERLYHYHEDGYRLESPYYSSCCSKNGDFIIKATVIKGHDDLKDTSLIYSFDYNHPYGTHKIWGIIKNTVWITITGDMF